MMATSKAQSEVQAGRFQYRAVLMFVAVAAMGASDGCDCSNNPPPAAQCTTDNQCAVGKRCDNGACVAGCAAVHCPSGACHDQNTCAECLNDGQCGGATPRCNLTTNTCTGCATGTACQNSCIDTTAGDRNHCGGCGVQCTGSQFCSGAACRPTQFRYLCDNPVAVMVRDGIGTDNSAGEMMADGFAANCAGMQIIRTETTNPTYIDQGNGAPLLGSKKTLIAAGGPFWQRPVNYLEIATSTSPVYFANEGESVFLRRRSNNTNIVSSTFSELNSHHDFFVVEMVVSPNNGTLVVIAYGFDGAGTLAGAWYLANEVLPNRNADSQQAYVVEWSDTNNNNAPDLADSFIIRGQL